MLYKFLKIWFWLGLKIYCRKIIINQPALLKNQGPLLIAANHSNSFFDAFLIDVLFQKPVTALARGDAFKGVFIDKLLHALKMLPVYRASEGKQFITANYNTFDYCYDLFRKRGIVLVFSEGRCVNQWHLRPLMKGTARLALNSWKKNIPLQVLPIGINYHSFHRLGKNIIINIGQPFTNAMMSTSDNEGLQIQQFNQYLTAALQPLVLEMENFTNAHQAGLFIVPQPLLKRITLAIPAAIGYVAHAPLYLYLRHITLKINKKQHHYDSILAGLLILSYPLFLIVTVALAYLLFKTLAAGLLLILLPFCAWSFVQLHAQFDEQ